MRAACGATGGSAPTALFAGLTPFSSQPITLNGGGAVSRGVELAGTAGLTNALRFRWSWSHTHAELSQDSPALLEGGADAFKGDRLSGAPRQQGSLLASYGVRLGGGTALELLYGYTYIGDVLTRIGRRCCMNTLWGWGRASWAGCGPDVRRGGQTLIMGYSADKSPLIGHLAGPLRRLEPLVAQRQEKCGPNRPTPTGYSCNNAQ